MTNLSKAAETALIDSNNSTGRIPVNAHGADLTPKEAIRELRDAGLIGENNGLTMKGRIAKDRIAAARLDELF